MEKATTPEMRDRMHCLITEVVVPGFDWEDHDFLTRDELEKLFGDFDGGEKVAAFSRWLKPSS